MEINIKNLTFGYCGHPVLDNVSIRIPEGKLTVIIGKNGSGKSTLLKLIAGIYTPQRGSIEVLGKDLKRPFNLREGETCRIPYPISLPCFSLYR